MNAVTAQPARLRRIGIAVLAASAALISAGCAAGQHAATAQETPAVDANVGTDVGNIQIRGVAIAAPPSGVAYSKGANADLILTIVNIGHADDTLTGVTTSAATDWTTFDDQSDANTSVPVATSSDATAEPATATATPSSAASSPTEAPEPGQTITVPAGAAIGFGVPTTQHVLVLQGLTNILYPAASVSITFTFASAGSVTIPVPVQLTDGGGTSVLPTSSSSSD